MLKAMRFKDFVWPHNPEKYSVDYRRKTAVLKVPGGEFVTQDLGKTAAVMRGEGAFYGKDAYKTFLRLAAVFASGGPGRLEHPLWPATDAVFTRLELGQAPQENFVAYRFEFEECESSHETMVLLGTGKEKAVWHLVSAEDTIWSIAAKYGVTVAELLEKNGRIDNPNRLTSGQLVRVL